MILHHKVFGAVFSVHNVAQCSVRTLEEHYVLSSEPGAFIITKILASRFYHLFFCH